MVFNQTGHQLEPSIGNERLGHNLRRVLHIFQIAGIASGIKEASETSASFKAPLNDLEIKDLLKIFRNDSFGSLTLRLTDVFALDLGNALDARRFVGRAPEQVDTFIANVVEPIRQRYVDLGNQQSEQLRV